MMLLIAIFIAHGSIDLNAQYAEEDYIRKWTEKVLGRQKSFGAQ